MRYHIFDPTGNITALVSDCVDVDEQPRVASDIMQRHPDVEQVGFVSMPTKETEACSSADVTLRMAGGEFCGNATMCAAVYYAMGRDVCPADVSLSVSGTSGFTHVGIRIGVDGTFNTCVAMPPVLGIEYLALTYGDVHDTIPVVRMEGISHAIVESSSPLFDLKYNRAGAADAIRAWCERIGSAGLGVQFLDRGGSESSLTPLVYVPAGNTLYWENSCASGSAAVAAFLSAQRHAPVDLTLREPGGRLRVLADGKTGSITLHGTVRPLESHTI